MFTRLTIYPAQKPFFEDLLKDVYRMRKRVFVDGRGWPLTVDSDGGERDSFDDARAVNVALLENGELRASARLNPAPQGLLAQVFPSIVDEPWGDLDQTLECSRFAVDPDIQGRAHRIWAARLLWAAGMAGLAMGKPRFVCVTDPAFERVLRFIGGQPRRLGQPRKSAEGHGVLALEMPGDDAAVARVGDQAALPVDHRQPIQEGET